MKKTLLFQFFLICVALAQGQTGNLKGVIYDSVTKVPLESATVSIFNQDSTLVTYRLSDKNGMVSFDKLPLKKKLLVNVNFIGYAPYYSWLQLNGNDSLHVFLSFSTNDTSSVVVNSIVPVRMNGDTMEINPGAFKMKEHQVVEELLNQVPGITIWSDGSITAGGRKVQNLYVNGKPFLGSTDPRIATQNLPKSAIDKIQLYQEYDRANIGRTEAPQPADSTLTMNIKLKEAARKGYFGKGGLGYGTGSTAESDLVMQMYNKKSSLAIGGGYNNINKNIGNVSQLLQNNTFRTTSPDLYRAGRLGGNGLNKSYSASVSLNHNFGQVNTNSLQNNRITVNYNHNGTDAQIITQRLRDRISAGSEQFEKDNSRQNTTSYRQSLDVNYVRTNSYSDNLNFSGSASRQNRKGTYSQYTEITGAAGALQSTNSTSSRQTDNSYNESFHLNYARNDNDRPLMNIDVSGGLQHNYSSSSRDVTSIFRSMTVGNRDTSYNRQYTNTNESFNVQVNANYGGLRRLLFGRYNLGGVNLSFKQDFNFSRINNHSVVTDFDSLSKNYQINKNLTNDDSRQTTAYSPGLSFVKSFSKSRTAAFRSFSVRAGLTGDFRTEENTSSIAQRNLNRSFQFIRYNAGVNLSLFNYNKSSYNVSLNYDKNFDYPSIDALYTIVDDINVYNITIGNPNLKNRTIHSVNLSTVFNTQNTQSPYSVSWNINGGYSLSENPVSDSVINTLSGKRISYYINAGQSSNQRLDYTFNISRRFRKNSIQLVYNGNYSAGKQPNYIDGAYNLSKNVRISNQVSVRFLLASTLTIGLTERLEENWVNQTVSTLNSFRNSSNTTSFNVNLNYPQNFSFGSTFDYISTSTLDKSTTLWNIFATHRFMKQQAELKISAMDILKQYVNIFTSANAYGTSTSITNGLQQYFMLTFAYYPRKFGKKAGASNM